MLGGSYVPAEQLREKFEAVARLASGKEVDDCTDLVQLDRWFDRALTARTAADIFRD